MQAFHLFHTSCLIHWVLLCELEILTNQSNSPKVKRRSRRKTAAKHSEVQNDDEMKALSTVINCVICPECQGTGTIIDGQEKPTIPLSKVLHFHLIKYSSYPLCILHPLSLNVWRKYHDVNVLSHSGKSNQNTVADSFPYCLTFCFVFTFLQKI